jgi:hypothetical protein
MNVFEFIVVKLTTHSAKVRQKLTTHSAKVRLKLAKQLFHTAEDAIAILDLKMKHSR